MAQAQEAPGRGGSGGTANPDSAGGAGRGGSGGGSVGQWGPEFLVEAGEGQPLNPQVALDDAGNGWVTWSQNSGTRSEVRARRYEAAAASWGPEQLIDGGSGNAVGLENIAPSKTSSPFRLQSAGSGAFTIASWLDGTTPDTVPRVSLFEQTKAVWTATTLGPVGAKEVRAAVGADGSAIATWIQGGLKARTYRGGAWNTEVTIDAGDVVTNGELVVGPDGTATVVWSTMKGVFAGRGRDTTFSAPTLISSEVDRPGGASQLALLPDGGVLAIWIQSDGISNSVFWNRWDPQASAWKTADKVERLPAGMDSPALATNTAGKAVAAWASGDQSSGDTYASVYLPDTGWSTMPAKIDYTFEVAPRVGIDSTGAALAILGWSNVYFTQSKDGLNWTTSRPIPTTDPHPRITANTSQWELAVAANGTAMAVWRDTSAGRDLYAQLYRPTP